MPMQNAAVGENEFSGDRRLAAPREGERSQPICSARATIMPAGPRR
jgi:hypothetical protein